MYSNYEASEGQSQVLPSIFVKIPAQINRQFQRSEKGDRIKAEDSFLFLSDAKDEGSQQCKSFVRFYFVVALLICILF